MSLADEIFDEFGELSPAERHETTASYLQEFGDTMRDNNKRIFSRVLDMIAETEGDDKLHLDMLATHLDIEDPRYIEAKSRDMPEFTSFSDYRARTHLGDDSGIYNTLSEPYIARHLSALEAAVRKNADRDLLGSLADSLQLPSEFIEFLKHTSGAFYPNLDKTMFDCTFATAQWGEEEHAQPLEELERFADFSGFQVAAGWQAGHNDMNSWVHYLLCRFEDELDEPWQWRIFTNNMWLADGDCYDSIHDFLAWYCNAYDRVDWKAVQRGINSLNERCKEASAKDQE